jgi:hypothetical protein
MANAMAPFLKEITGDALTEKRDVIVRFKIDGHGVFKTLAHSLEEAAKFFSETRDSLGVGASEVGVCTVWRRGNIARISYNGRVWEF